MPTNNNISPGESKYEEIGKLVKDDFLPGKDWKKSKVGAITGFSPAKRAIVGVAKSPVHLGMLAFRGVKSIFTGDKVPELPTDSQDPAERFEAALEFYERNEGYVATATKTSARNGLVYGLMTLFMTVYAIYLAANTDSLVGMIFPFVLHLAVVPLTIRSLFWNWQLRNRSLRSFKEFRQRPDEWIPSFRVSAITNALVGFAAFSTAYLLGVGEAFAADVINTDLSGAVNNVLGDIPETDVFGRTMGYLFGGVGPVPEIPGTGTPWLAPLGNAFHIFNTTLLSVASAMLGWHTLSGMVATAQEGQVLGQRWNQIWAPVRVTIGIGSLVPMPSGFAAVQLLVLQIAMWGGGLANQVWYAYIDTFAAGTATSGVNSADRMRDQGAIIYAMTEDGEGRKFVINLVEKSICLQGLKELSDIQAKSIETRTGQKVTNYDEAAMEKLLGRGYFANNPLADLGGIHREKYAYGEAAPALSLQEVHMTDVQGFVGLDVNGALIDFDDIDWNAGNQKMNDDPTDGIIEKKTFSVPGQIKPIIEYNYGPFCGKVRVNMADISVIADFLEKNTGSDDQMGRARDILRSAANNLKNAIDTGVMDYANRAAYAATRVHFDPDSFESKEALNKYEASLYEADGPIATNVFNAYSGYLAASREGKNGIQNALASALKGERSIDKVVDLAKELGWSSSGAFYLTIARMTEHSIEAAQFDISDSGNMLFNQHMLFEKGGDKYREDLMDVFRHKSNGVMVTYQKVRKLIYDAASPSVYERAIPHVNGERSWTKQMEAGKTIREYYNSEGEKSAWDGIQIYVNDATKKYMMPILTFTQPDPNNAFLHMTEMGHMIISTAGVATSAAVAVKVAAVGADAAKDSFWAEVGKAISGPAGIIADMAATVILWVMRVIYWLGTMIGFLLLAVGLVHAYIIPMLPFIFMFFFTVGMLILIAEALVAAPIWAFMHVRMDGQDFVDQVQKPGYMIAFNLFLRPVLAVFGLILSFMIFSAAFFFLNEIFNIAAEAIMPSDTGFAAVGIISLILIQLFLHYHLALRSFSLISQVPDRVSRWFGQGGENLNEEGDSMNAIAVMNREAEGRTQQVAARAGMGRKDKNEQNSSSGANQQQNANGGKSDGGGR